MSTVELSKIMTDKDIEKCLVLYNECVSNHYLAAKTFVDRCELEIIKPILPEINKETKQENDARYIAFAIMNAIYIIGNQNAKR